MRSRLRVPVWLGFALGIGLIALVLVIGGCRLLPHFDRWLVSVLSFPLPQAIDIGDGGVLSEDPCGPPCFWGIVPGETREAEVIAILQERGVYDVCEAWDIEARGGRRGFRCGGRRLGIAFEQGGDVVDSVSLTPSLPITVEELVEKYGEPEGVRVGAQGVHLVEYQLDMAYLSMLSVVRLAFQDSYPYSVRPSTTVDLIAVNSKQNWLGCLLN